MAVQAEPRREQRPPLSKERVLRTAVALADEGGIESLTMRRLAQAIGLEAMSLYHYVASKDEILAGIVDLVVSEFELPSARGGWKRALRRTAISAHDTLVRHPWAANLMLSGAVGPARKQYMDGILGCLRLGGFSAEMTHHAYHALDSHILGFTLWQVGIMADAENLGDLATTFLRELPADEYPHLAEHVEQHLRESDDDEEGEFEFGLDLILDGLQRTLDKPRRRDRSRPD